MKLAAHLRSLECIYTYLCDTTTYPWRDIKHNISFFFTDN
jgi:hypothetical protein